MDSIGAGDGVVRPRRHQPLASPPPSSGAQCHYDDDDDEDKERKMYSGACPAGKLFLNPCLCLSACAAAAVGEYRRRRRRSAATTNSNGVVGGGGGGWSLLPSFGPGGLGRGGKPARRPPPRLYFRHATSFVEEGPSERDRRVAAVAAAVLLPIFVLAASLRGGSPPRRGRHATLAELESSVRVAINRYDLSGVDDLGGWLVPRPFPSIKTLSPMLVYGEDGGRPTKDEPDYGGLEFLSLSKASTPDRFRRKIDRDDYLKEDEYYRRNRIQIDKRISPEYEDDDEIVGEDEDYERGEGRCRRTAWQTLYRPNCNAFHEVPLDRDFDGEGAGNPEDSVVDPYYISHGYYRDVWIVEHTPILAAGDEYEATALKQLRYKYKFNYRDMETVRHDAMVMERLAGSPRIVDAYGHCGTSVYVELVSEEVEEFIVPGSGYASQDELDDSEDVNPRNGYNATEKLTMALEMAESIADLHGFADGVIVHDDVQLCQWLRTPDGKLKLGDFNRAEVMLWDEEGGRYCRYKNGAGYGNYRAPEEFAVRYLDEKIDVFSFGNNIYALLTGLWVFYENEDDGVVQKNLIDGRLPYVDDRYRTRSYAEGKLVELMERCWVYEPEKRIDIFDAVKFLRDAVEENSRREKEEEGRREEKKGR